MARADGLGYARPTGRLEAALTAANAPAASLALEGPVARTEGGKVATPFSATPRAEGSGRAGLRLVHPERPTGQLLSVQGFDGSGGVLRVFVLDEREPAHPTRRPVERNDDVDHRRHRVEGLEQLIASDVKAEVPYE
jgi:hypothetical protein